MIAFKDRVKWISRLITLKKPIFLSCIPNGRRQAIDFNAPEAIENGLGQTVADQAR